MKRIVYENHSRPEYSSRRPYLHKNCARELHKSNIHGRAATAIYLITESSAQMRKRCCHDHKIWTSDNWKPVLDMVR
jgi:hypothetical protein